MENKQQSIQVEDGDYEIRLIPFIEIMKGNERLMLGDEIMTIQSELFIKRIIHN